MPAAEAWARRERAAPDEGLTATPSMTATGPAASISVIPAKAGIHTA